MKRHTSLQPLSRDHHDALILAQLLKVNAPGYKGLPSDRAGRIEYAMQLFEKHIAEHFDEEEKVIALSKNLDPELDRLNEQIIAEHGELRSLFKSLTAHSDPVQLNDLGVQLENHIRKEERTWFPLLEKVADEELIRKIYLVTTPPVNDITNRQDIRLLVDRFYEKVIADKVIGHIFTDIVKVNWQKHLPVMYDFWENAIFYSGTYSGNPLKTHMHLNKIAPLTGEHFRHWTLLFTKTVDELFKGEKAALAKNKATSIAKVMELKINPPAAEEA